MVIYLGFFLRKKNVAMLFPDQHIKIDISIYLNVVIIFMTFISKTCSYRKTLIFLIQLNCLNIFHFAINMAIFSRFKFCVHLENIASQHRYYWRKL